MNTTNVCKLVNCYFNSRNGCQLFLVSGHCPLALESDISNNQYWLFIDNASPARLEELKEIHEQKVESLEFYKKHKEFDELLAKDDLLED